MLSPTSSSAPARLARHLRVLTLLALLASNFVPVATLSAAERQLGRAQAASEAALERAANPAPAAVDIAATKIDSLQVDANGNGRPDAGDTLRYTIGISNTGTTDALSVTLNDVLDPNTTLVAGSLRVSPLAFADQYFATRDTPLPVPAPGLLANDTGVPAPAVASHGPTGDPGRTAAGASGPTDQGGTVTVNANGSFTYTPPSGFTGEDGFSYRIANGIGNSATADVALTIRQAPTAVDDSYNGATDAPINQAAPGVLANDTGAPAPRVVSYGTSAAPGTVAVPGAPTPTDQGGTVQVNADGSFSYTPPAGFQGNDRFGYTIGNGVGANDSAVVTIVLDRAPRVTSTTPVSNATGIGTAAPIVINFSEPVGAGVGAFRLECPVGTNIPVTPSASPATSFTLTPGSPLPQGVTCRVTVVAANITDTDAADPPDTMAADYVFSFTTDSAPRVTSTAPVSNAAGIGTAAPIVINFSEPVNAPLAAFQLECPAGTPRAFTLSASPAASFTLTPDSPLPAGVTCRVTVVAANVTDADAGDPPDTMAANYVFSFSTDEAPRVTTTGPLSGATGIATNAQITINFSEQVNATAAAFQLECPAGTPVAFTMSASPANGFALTPTGGLPEGVTCRVTVVAANITDTDAGDPPDTMAANFVFTFSTDAAPRVVSATPSGSGPITVLFSEPVSAPAAAFQLQCPVGTDIPFTVSGGPTSFTLTPSGALPEGSACRLTVVAANVSDLDAADPPDTMVADFTFDFTVDAAPRVASTTPISGAAGIEADTTITIDFSEPVVAGAGAFVLECPAGTPRAFTRAGGPTSFTLTPSANLPAGATCRVTVVASQVTDVDANDPPDQMSANYVFSFTIDEAPRVVSTAPVSNAASLPTTSTIVINFSEPVNAPLAAFQLECPAGTPRAFTVAGNPGASITLTPSSPLPAGVTCRVTVVAANVTDVDAADPPDAMAANYVFSFSTDAAPTVVSTTPANGATTVSSATTITVTFSEPVNAPLAAFSVECPLGDPVATFAVSASPATVFTLTSSEPLPEGLVCTVTITGSLVTDVDAADPPDAMAADYVFSFTTDEAPTVASTNPADGAALPPSGQITVTFSEPVNVTAASFEIQCPAGGANRPFTLSGTGATYTLTPSPALPTGLSCQLRVIASQVTDTDPGDPPDQMADDYLISFVTDEAPRVISTSPLSNAASISTTAAIVINFSEPVNAPLAAFQLECPVGTPRAFTVAGNPGASITLTPSSPLPAGVTCRVTVVAANVTDVDASDPPDTMAANYVFSFTIDTPPTVVSTIPANGSTAISTTAPIVINFSEPVNVTAASFTISCTVSGANTFTISGAGASYILTPTNPFAPGETCTVTVVAANVTDVDNGDPPDNMPANYVFSFATDTPPDVLSTTPANNDSGRATNTTIQVVFTEPVNVTAASFQLECPLGTGVAFTLSGSGASYTLTPTGGLPEGASCRLTVIAANVTDVDAADPPDTMPANRVINFSTDAAPEVTSTTPANGATGVSDTANIVVNFSEPVNVTGASFIIECPTGTPIPFALSGSGASYTLDPTASLPGGVVCVVTVIAAQVSDTDAGDPPDTMAANYVFSFGIPPRALGDHYAPTIVGNTNIDTSRVSNFSVLTNDGAGAATIVGPPARTSAAGGQVVLNLTTGTFSYNPPPGYEGGDSFTYQLTGPTGTSGTASVTFAVDGMIWYVDANATTNGDGRLGTPFNQFGGPAGFDASAADDPDDSIFLYSSATQYLGNVTLKTRQRLLGQGSVLPLDENLMADVTFPSDSLPPATNGTRPVITAPAGHGVTVRDHALLRGFNIGDRPNGYAINSAIGMVVVTAAEISVSGQGGLLNLFGGTFEGDFEQLSSSSSTATAINLLSMQGFVTNSTASAITHATATTATVHINGGRINLNYNGSVTKTAGGRLIEIRNMLSGSASFTSATADVAASTGVALTNSDNSLTIATLRLGATNRLTSDAVTLTSFDGTVNLGDAIIRTAAGRGVVAVGGSATSELIITDGTIDAQNAAVDLSNLRLSLALDALTSANSPGLGARFDTITAGSVAVTTTALTTCGGICLQITNSPSRTFGFGPTTITKTAATLARAVDLSANPAATISFGALSITNGNGAGLFNSNGGNVSNSSGSVTTTGGAALDIAGASAASRVAISLTFSSLSVTNTPNTGVRLAFVSGAGLTVSGNTAISVNAGTSNVIDVNDSTATALSFSSGGTVTITSRRGPAVSVNAATAAGNTITFGALTAANPNGAAGDAFIIQNSSSIVTVASATLSNAQADAIQLTSNTGSFTLNGGTLSASGESGIDLSTAANIDINGVTISGAGSHGVNGATVSGFRFENSGATRGVIQNTGTDPNEHGIVLNPASGTIAIASSNISNYGSEGVRIMPSGGTATISGNDLQISNDSNANGGTAFLVSASGNASGSVRLTNSAFTTVTSMFGFFAGDNNTAQNTNFSVVVSGNSYSNPTSTALPYRGGEVITLNNQGANNTPGEANTMNFNVTGNTITNPNGFVFVAVTGNNGSMNGHITDNGATGVDTGIGVFVRSYDNAVSRVLINNNTMTFGPDNVGRGIDVASKGFSLGTFTGRLDAVITNNRILPESTPPGSFNEGIYAEADLGNSICVDIAANTVNGDPGADVRVRRLNGNNAANTEFEIEQLTGDTATAATIQAAIIGANTLANSFVGVGNLPAGTLFLDRACQDAPAPPTLKAAGGAGPGGQGAISQAELDAAAAAAISQWRAAGLSAEQQAALELIDVSLADLAGDRLGDAQGTIVSIDRDAAGWGWSAGGMDLTSAVAHEIGHALGFDHAASGLMADTLATGARHAPQAPQDTLTHVIGTIPAGQSVLAYFDARIANPLPGNVQAIYNQAVVSGGNFSDVLSDDPDLAGASDPTVTYIRSIVYAPMVMRPMDQADLIVRSVTARNDRLEVVIANIGNIPVAAAFWVDVYINPTTAPTQVNQRWQDLGARGAVWGVTRALAPGESLTLVTNDAYYRRELSEPGRRISAGTPLYAQVDSDNAATNYGAIREGHEITGGPYNNITSGSATLAVELPDGAPLADAPLAPGSERLPARPTP